ncbi:hypothetical protein D9M69_699740 [compost metagenome]
MLEGLRMQLVVGEPVAGAAVEPLEQRGIALAQLAAKEFGEQGVIAVPLLLFIHG